MLGSAKRRGLFFQTVKMYSNKETRESRERAASESLDVGADVCSFLGKFTDCTFNRSGFIYHGTALW